jgi:glycosyltransferase involved in cell wall biosynthesis
MIGAMRVLVMTPYPYGTVAGPRSSFELWERVLADAGIALEYSVFETDRLHEILNEPGRSLEKVREMVRGYGRQLGALRRLGDFDAVLVNREAVLVGPELIERLAKRRVPLIYLLDDPLYIPYRSPANGVLSYLKFFGKVGRLCAISATVIANSPSNAEFARRHNGNVWEVPSVVDADIYDGWRPKEGARDQVCIGWTGSATTVPNLQVIRGPLATLGRRDDVQLKFIGGDDFNLPDVPHEARRWDPRTEVEDLRTFDVGLLPLPLTDWTPHKFYLKLVQYMALGIPAVATPLGANPAVIDHGENGFLAHNDAEWVALLERLAADAELRERLGKRAAEDAHRKYTLQANAEKIVAAFRSALDRAPASVQG